MFTYHDLVISKIKFNKDGSVNLELVETLFRSMDHKKYVSPLCWDGSKLINFYKTQDWKKVLKRGVALRQWTTQGSIVVGIEWYNPKTQEFEPCWYVGNDFDDWGDVRKKTRS